MDQERGEKPVLEGTVSSIIFQNEENGYTILRLDAGEEEMTVVYKAFKLYHPAKIKSPLFITNQELISQSTI